MKYLGLFAVVGSAFAASPALAQDTTFSGPYAGGYLGLDRVGISDGVDSGHKTGVAFGGLLGYNADVGGAVVGVEAEIGDASTSQTETDVFAAGDSAKLAANRDLFLSIRAGFKASPNALVYAKGGYATTRLKATYDDGAGTTDAGSDSISGVRLGAGVEFLASEHVSIRAEYRYTNYNEYKFLGVPTGLNASRNQVVVGFIGHF